MPTSNITSNELSELTVSRKSEQIRRKNKRKTVSGEHAGTADSDRENARVGLPTLGYYDELSPSRLRTYSSCSLLRAGNVFAGTQQSGNTTHEVHVVIKHVDLAQSFMCGYLTIQGLTAEFDTLTTYFEAQIISEKYSFYTNQKDWGADSSIDITHWGRFPSWRLLHKDAIQRSYVHKNFDQKKYIYMRWKECFLVPDHTLHNIPGASFAGFYYICFNQEAGTFSGLYYHKDSEKYQQLELGHRPDHGVSFAYEFR
ncbi:hypothetical protein CANCADRAFT_30482 [Tortispora caseinolytica NRRL Y-17796]|uniref:Vacuolar import and degradation protein n=1 Tax=Tortispora caseinolytica NRRL Y-17796 TaxID=767744 RepID=A0A1E4TKJ8_9ASCO|nr:hypothetical protein CANCADRAFT_30482 [Tortispora caseinolytica NRRL Y-17796]